MANMQTRGEFGIAPNINANASTNGLLPFLADIFIIFFGAWTLTHQISYFGALTFYQSWNIALFTSGMSVIIYTAGTLKSRWKGYLTGGSPTLWVAILTSTLLTLTLYRPDSDDELYLAHAILALDFTFDKMRFLPGISSGYALTSYDFIRGALSYYTGIPILYAFYTVGPAIISVLVVIFQWRLLKLISVRYIGFTLLVFFIVMLSWGDIHRSPANLGYVKFFQGKGALVWVAIPAMLFYWLQFEVTRSKRSLLLLFLSAVAGVGFSPTGIPIAILMLTLFFISGLTQIKNKVALIKKMSLLITLLFTFLALGLVMTQYFGVRSNGIHTSVGFRQLNNLSDYLVNWEMLHFVLGESKRFWLALLAVLLCPFLLPPSPSRGLLRVYLGLCIALMIMPFSSAVMAQLTTGSFAWRWLFICPFVLCIMVSLDYVFRSEWSRYLKVGIISSYLGLFIWGGPLLVSESNYTQIRLLFHQLPDEQKIILRPAPYNNQTTKLDGARIISLKDGRPL